jgi:hypothetical protein
VQEISLLPGDMGVSPIFKFPQEWGIKGVDTTKEEDYQPSQKQRAQVKKLRSF